MELKVKCDTDSGNEEKASSHINFIYLCPFNLMYDHVGIATNGWNVLKPILPDD